MRSREATGGRGIRSSPTPAASPPLGPRGRSCARARGRVGTRIAVLQGRRPRDPQSRRRRRPSRGRGRGGAEPAAKRADKEPAPRARRRGLASLPRGDPGFVSALRSGLRPPCPRQVSEPRSRAGAPAFPFPKFPPLPQPQFPPSSLSSPVSAPGISICAPPGLQPAFVPPPPQPRPTAPASP